MFSLRNRFGIPGVISVVALVFAMVGGAFAAKNVGGSGDPQATAAAKKVLRGPRGPRGLQGPTGPQGTAGQPGANGKDGSAGATGPTGPAGPTGPEGPEGPEGAEGAEGSPWTAGGTLPPGAMETGSWGFGPDAGQTSSGPLNVPMSLPIPLEKPIEVFDGKVHAIPVDNSETEADESEPPAGCAGSVADPEAEAGHLCIFVGQLNNAIIHPIIIKYPVPGGSSFGIGPAGGQLFIFMTGAGASGNGTFAVAGPTE